MYGDENPLGMSASEFAVTIVEMLNSSKSSEELQTELFDLCGFDRFDMIGAILEKRAELVQSFKVKKFISIKRLVEFSFLWMGGLGS